MNKVYDTVAKAIKEQWDTQVNATGTGLKSLAVHETALRVAYALKKIDIEFDVDEFLTKSGVEA